MNRAIVFAAQQFIGFELCKGLLNSGYNVSAVDHDEIVKDIYEEKWLEIGRNANVTYYSNEQMIDTNHHSYVCFVPIYDYFALEQDQFLNEWKETFQIFCENNKTNIKLFIFILPSHFLSRELKGKFADFHKIVLEIIDYVSAKKVKEFYIPTIYGPWQSDTFLFQQLISGNQQQDFRDDCSDAIYVEDVIQTIIANIEEDSEEKEILLQSEHKNQWEKCVHFLNKSYDLTKSLPHNNRIFPRIIKVSERTSYIDGLELQIKCFERNKE